MELKEYLAILRKRLLMIVVITLCSVLISAVMSYFILKPIYKANISVLIGKSQNTTTNSSNNYSDLLLYQNSVKTYSILATSRKVAEDVIYKLSLNMKPEEVISMISATPNSSTEFMTLTVKAKDAKLAQDIANQLAKSLRNVSIDIKKEDAVQLVDDAMLPSSPDSPKPTLNLAISVVVGILVSIGIAFIIEYIDNTIKSQEELERLLELPVIGLIPYVDKD